MTIMPAPDMAAAENARAHAERLGREVATRWPTAWAELDHMRTHPPMPWPDWCLLPMAATVAVTTRFAPVVGLHHARLPHASVAALYAWRFARSVYLVEPSLMRRLLTQVPDPISLADVANLPEWCVYVAAGHPEGPGAGVWMHLEHDAKSGRPELRLLIDFGQDELDRLLEIPVYLDRESTTQALADFRSNALAILRLNQEGANNCCRVGCH